MGDYITSVIRTIVPIIIGSIVGWLAAKGINIKPEDIAAVTALLTALFSGLYYVISRALEQRFPQAGILLGSTKQPEYTETPKG